MIDVKEICRKAKQASYALAACSADEKNAMLSAIADALERDSRRPDGRG